MVRIRALRERFEAGLRQKSKDAVIFGADIERLPNTTLFAIPGVKAETAIIALDLEGIGVSSGAACSSGKVQASHVLSAMAVEPTLARGAIRISVGYGTTESDIDRCLCHTLAPSGERTKAGMTSRANRSTDWSTCSTGRLPNTKQPIT